MKRSVLRALALCVGAVFVANGAFAQTQGTSSRDKPATTGLPSSSSTYGPSGLSGSSRAVRLTELIQTSVTGQRGDSVGRIQDVIVDPTTGQAQFVVLSTAGTTTGTATVPPGSAIGGQFIAVPWSLISAGTPGQVTINAEPAKLQSAPGFSQSSWPTMDQTWAQRIYSHFGVEPPAGMGAPGTGSGTGTGVGNPFTPGLPSTPGTPDINPPGATTPRPGTGGTGTIPGTAPSGTGPGGTGAGGTGK